MRPRVGIMQGRLTPPCDGRLQCFPRHTWEAEFRLAREARLATIEWIYDDDGAETNPIGNDAGLARISDLVSSYGSWWARSAQTGSSNILCGPVHRVI